MMESTDAGMPGGCLSARMSRTLLGCERPMSTSSSRPSGIPAQVDLRVKCLRCWYGDLSEQNVPNLCNVDS